MMEKLAVHLLLPALLAGMCTKEAEHLLSDVSDLFEHHLQDWGTTMTTVYNQGNYSKAILISTYHPQLMMCLEIYQCKK